MGIGIYIYEIKNRRTPLLFYKQKRRRRKFSPITHNYKSKMSHWARPEIKSISHKRHLRRKFKNYSFSKKLKRYTNYYNIFRDQGLKYKDWWYDHTDDNRVNIFKNRYDDDKKLEIKEEDLIRGKCKRTVVKREEIFNMSASGKVKAIWHRIYDAFADDYFRLFARFLNLITYRDVEIFIDKFIRNKYKDEFRNNILPLINDKTYMVIYW